MEDFNLDQKVDTILDEIGALRRAIRCVAPFTANAVPDLPDPNDQSGAKPFQPRPALPDPRLVRHIIRMRQARANHFKGELFADPAWDMLLELTAARAEHRLVTVKILCIASGVPHTTALRWLTQMSDLGFITKSEDGADKRRTYVSLSDKGVRAAADYFAGLVPFSHYAV